MRGRECRPESLCHGCLKYTSDHPEFIKKANKLYKDRVRMRAQRQTDLPITLTTQEDSENEFLSDSESDSFPTFESQQYEGDSSGEEEQEGIPT